MSTKKKRKDYWPVVAQLGMPQEAQTQAEREARWREAVAVVKAMEKIGKTLHVESVNYSQHALVFKARRS